MYDVGHVHFTTFQFACADLEYREKIIFTDTEGLIEEAPLFGGEACKDMDISLSLDTNLTIVTATEAIRNLWKLIEPCRRL